MKYSNTINLSNNQLINISDKILKQEGYARPSKYKFIRTGHVNSILVLNENLILRFSNDSTSVRRLYLESKIMNSIKDKIPVPKIISFGRIGSIGYQFLSYIKGEPLSKVWNDITQYNKEKIVIQIVRLLKTIHKIKANNFKFICLPTHKTDSWRKFNDYEWKDIFLYLNKIGIYKDFIDESSKYYRRSRQCLYNENSSHLIHGDLYFDNILINDNRVVAFIDFEFSMFATKDRELYKIEEFVRKPSEYGFRNNRYDDFIDLFRKYYPEIFDTKNIMQKLDLYDFIYTWKAFVYNDKFNIVPRQENLEITVKKISNILNGEITRIV